MPGSLPGSNSVPSGCVNSSASQNNSKHTTHQEQAPASYTDTNAQLGKAGKYCRKCLCIQLKFCFLKVTNTPIGHSLSRVLSFLRFIISVPQSMFNTYLQCTHPKGVDVHSSGDIGNFCNTEIALLSVSSTCSSTTLHRAGTVLQLLHPLLPKNRGAEAFWQSNGSELLMWHLSGGWN